jgi:hypothetical protein
MFTCKSQVLLKPSDRSKHRELEHMSRRIALVLIVMAIGRAMTIPFIARAGDGGQRDPPDAWLMPLVGDAAIGLAAIGIAFLVWKHPTPGTWAAAIAWSAIGAFDAVAALLVEISTPWPEFFMLEIFGRSMFFAAVALHAAIIYLLNRSDALHEFGVQRSASEPVVAPSV